MFRNLMVKLLVMTTKPLFIALKKYFLNHPKFYIFAVRHIGSKLISIVSTKLLIDPHAMEFGFFIFNKSFLYWNNFGIASIPNIALKSIKLLLK